MDEPVKRGPGRPRKKPAPLEVIKPPKHSTLPTVVDLPEGDNNKYTAFTLDIMRLPTISIDDPQQLQQRIYDYFQLCADHDMKPGVAGLSLALGVDRRRLWEIKAGVDKAYKVPQECKEAIKMAYRSLETLMENYVQNGKINPVSGIFLFKNNFDYRDQQEYVLTPNQMGDTPDIKALEAKYEDLPE